MSDLLTPDGTMSSPPIDGGALLELVQELSSELHSGRRPVAALDSKLDDDLGLDSLARMELLLRIERRFGVTVAQDRALAAESPRQLLTALVRGHQGVGPSPLSPTTGATPTAIGPPPPETATLLDALVWFARRDPGRVHIELEESDDATSTITYGQLFEEAERVASGLLERGLERGQKVALMLPTGRDFFVTFVGILLTGAVPVPIYPPFRASQLEDHLRRQALILDNARAALLVASHETGRAAGWLRSRLVELRAVVSSEELRGAVAAPRFPSRPSDEALLQYTSGSTGDPKGVILTHANLLANVRAIGEALDITYTDVVVSWLPLYHDMGLIGAWLGSLYHGCKVVVIPPSRFLARPATWLRALHRHRGTLSTAPNFAYEICASRVPESDLAGLDLSAWRLALNGSEPVRPGTIDRFTHRFAPYHFRPQAMTPVYGLAENSVALAFTPAGRGPRLDHVARAPFETAGRAELAGTESPTPLVFVSSGRPIPHHELRIIDELGRELPDRRTGRVQFRGPSATGGYFRNEAATRALFDGDWLETGDLGYVAGGELYITGRSKDVIIRAGRHVFPYEIEEIVGALPGIRKGGVAAFSAPDEKRGTEKLVIVAETRALDAQLPQLRASIDAPAVSLFGAAADDIVLVPSRTIPKTSSGKTRRSSCRELYLAGTLGQRKSPRRQIWALVARLWGPLVRRGLRAAATLAYAVWFWLCVALCFLPAWVLAVACPGERARGRLVSGVVRTFFFVAGIRLELDGAEQLDEGPRVLVFNHASYLDSLVLVALLPPGSSLVAKKELESNLLLRRALRRLGTIFVERFDAERAVREVTTLESLLRAGRSLIVFPEGTNRRIPGLFPFHEGAFLAAAQAGVPIIPGGIAGSRTVLRADQWFPRHGPITVTLRSPLIPVGHDWDAALALRDRARHEVAAASGEPLVG